MTIPIDSSPHVAHQPDGMTPITPHFPVLRRMARPDAEFQTISQLDPVARGTALTGGGWMASFNAVGNFNAGQVFNLLGTGPTAAVRIYATGAAMITSGGVNVVSTVTMPLPQNGGGQ